MNIYSYGVWYKISQKYDSAAFTGKWTNSAEHAAQLLAKLPPEDRYLRIVVNGYGANTGRLNLPQGPGLQMVKAVDAAGKPAVLPLEQYLKEYAEFVADIWKLFPPDL